MLYTAVLVACLASAPTDCRSHTMLITAGANPVSAYVEAQARAAEWLAQHPELKQRGPLIVHPGRRA